MHSLSLFGNSFFRAREILFCLEEMKKKNSKMVIVHKM